MKYLNTHMLHNWLTPAHLFNTTGLCEYSHVSQRNPSLMGAGRSQKWASELKLQMNLSAPSNMGFYRDPSNSCGWGLCTFTLLLAKPHGPWVSTREITPSLKLSPCSDPCVTSEAKQSSQTACLLHGLSFRICFRSCYSLSTVIIFGFAPTRGGNKLSDVAMCVPSYSTAQWLNLTGLLLVCLPRQGDAQKLPQKSRCGLKLLPQTSVGDIWEDKSPLSSLTVKEQWIFLQDSIKMGSCDIGLEKDSELKIPTGDPQIAMSSFIQNQVSRSPGSCPSSYFLQVAPGIFKLCFLSLGNPIHWSNLLTEILSAWCLEQPESDYRSSFKWLFQE